MEKRRLARMLLFAAALAYTAVGCTASGQDGSKSENDLNDQGKIVTIYYVAEQTAEIEDKKTEIHNEYDIWAALQEQGVLTEECELLDLEFDKDKNTIDLDFNSATGELIRSQGAAGEIQIIACIVNTYLEAYNSEGIRLTEEGKVLDTSHGGELEGYCGPVDLEN